MIYYSIANIIIECDVSFTIDIGDESKDFIIKESSEIVPDLRIEYFPVKELNFNREIGHWSSTNYYTNDDTFFCDMKNGTPFAIVERIKDNGDLTECIKCYYQEDKEIYIKSSAKICDLFSLESVLINYNCLILHSSFIRCGTEGILFAAPSGTGKSTQADLWVRYEGAEIINGDRSGVRMKDGKVKAYGLPYSGSSYVYRNESANVKCIVVLRQAKENSIRRLAPAEAISYLYPELTVHQWERMFVDKALDLLTQIVFEVPIYLLSCLPDKGAVDLLKNTIRIDIDKRISDD